MQAPEHSANHYLVPQTEADWRACLADPMWRVCSGQLYKIMVKGDDESEGHVMPFLPNAAQIRLIKRLHYRNVILKARQLGFTTLIAILWLDHALFVPDQRVGIIAHNLDDAAAIFRDKVRFAYNNLPDPIRGRFALARDSAKELHFAHNNSAIRVATSMRGGTIHRLHICLSGSTEILLKDGLTKCIRDIVPGDMVMTGNGSYLPAIALITNRIEDIGQPMLSLDIHGWHENLKLTANHQILTREFKTGVPVWKEAGEVSAGDYIAFPVREIKNRLRDKCLPFGDQPYAYADGKRVKTTGRRIPADRNLGILAGMYLAEGYRRRSEVTFAIHRDETAWFTGLLGEFSEYFSSYRVDDCKTSLTTAVVVNGRCFAEFLARFFGDGVDKRIPDAVWGYGRDFIDGLIWGYFQGDGCFTNLMEVQVTSIRPQLIHQMRMLLVSTRMGVASIYHRDAGQYYGRNCKETWVLKLHGAANWKFRQHFGLPLPEVNTRIGQIALAMDGNRNPIGRKNWRRGAAHYWMRIKSVDIAQDEPFVYDIALPSAPHSYTTVCGVVHNSEMGKIAAKYPEKAIEIVTGSLPAVPLNGIAIIESTAEGQEGEFFEIATRAENHAKEGRDLNPAEWRFHFFPWWADPTYTLPPQQAARVSISPTEHEYFDKIEAEAETLLRPGQRAWYIAKRDNDFSGDAEKMWQEMPSTSGECWQKSTEGTYFATQLARARSEGRICRIPHVQQVPVNTYWDIGSGDGTGIWSHQHIGPQHRFLRYMEGWGESYAHFVRMLRETGWIFGVHYLPHDAEQVRQLQYTVGKPIDMLRELAPDWTFVTVPRIQTIQHGINLTRTKFQEAWFDAEGCKEGLDHLSLYRKTWNARVGAWSDVPEKLAGHSEAADGFRQWAQGYDPLMLKQPNKRPNTAKRRSSGLTA